MFTAWSAGYYIPGNIKSIAGDLNTSTQAKSIGNRQDILGCLP